MLEVNACRADLPDHYVQAQRLRRALGRQTTALSFIVNRPAEEPGFRLERQEVATGISRYTTHAYAADRPAASATAQG